MKKWLLISIALGYVNTGFTAATKADVAQQKLNIINLLDLLRANTLSSNASEQTLVSVQNELKKTLKKITIQSSTLDPDCISFAYEKYYVSMNSSSAMSAASSACRSISDVEVAKFVFEKANISQTSETAMNTAAMLSGATLVNKKWIVVFAFEKYYISMPSFSAITQAANRATNVGEDALKCLQISYEAHFVSKPAAAAMDQAFQDCR